MNGKIPIFGAVASAYGFAFGRILTVLRLSWFWIAIMVAANLYWGPAVIAAVTEGVKAIPGGGQEAFWAAISGVQSEFALMSLIQGIGSTIIFVAFVRSTISQDFRDGVPVHLLSGMPDLRVFGVIILLVIAWNAFLIGFAIVFGLLAAMLGALGLQAVLGFLAIGLFFVLLWTMLRLSLVLPVAAVESNLGVERSWSIMKGNSLRMLIALLLTFIPFGIASSIVSGAVMGSQAGPFPQVDPADQAAFRAALLEWGGRMLEGVAANWPVYVGYSAVSGLLTSALWAGLLGRAYRAVTNMDGQE